MSEPWPDPARPANDGEVDSPRRRRDRKAGSADHHAIATTHGGDGVRESGVEELVAIHVLLSPDGVLSFGVHRRRRARGWKAWARRRASCTRWRRRPRRILRRPRRLPLRQRDPNPELNASPAPVVSMTSTGTAGTMRRRGRRRGLGRRCARSVTTTVRTRRRRSSAVSSRDEARIVGREAEEDPEPLSFGVSRMFANIPAAASSWSGIRIVRGRLGGEVHRSRRPATELPAPP